MCSNPSGLGNEQDCFGMPFGVGCGIYYIQSQRICSVFLTIFLLLTSTTCRIISGLSKSVCIILNGVLKAQGGLHMFFVVCARLTILSHVKS